MSIYGHFIEESTSVVALPEDLVSESVILEMKAKQIDLDDFKSASEAVKYICGYYINIIDTEDKVLTEITNRLEKVKNENQLKALAKDINTKYPEMTKAAYSEYDKSKGGELNTTFNKLKRVCSKFNIKYSDEAVEVKKAVDKDLLDLRKHILDTSSHWVKIVIDGSEYDAKTDKLDKLNAALPAAKSIDPVYYDSIFKSISVLYQLLIQETQYTLGDIFHIRKNLHLEKEKKIVYKVLNKLFKTKK